MVVKYVIPSAFIHEQSDVVIRIIVYFGWLINADHRHHLLWLVEGECIREKISNELELITM